MATKITLGKRPKSFKKEIEFPMLDGSTGGMEVTYAYRTRSEFAELNDEFQASLKAEADAEIARYKESVKQASEKREPVPEFSFTEAEITKCQAAVTVEYTMKIVEGWNLDVPFDKGAVEELVDTLPAAATKIRDDYRLAITEGRLGN